MDEDCEEVQIDLKKEDASCEREAAEKVEKSDDERRELLFPGRTPTSEAIASSHESNPEDTVLSSALSLFCRICHELDELTDENSSPCQCRGTLSLVHRSCLKEWLVASDSTECELCGSQFTVERIPKYSVLRSLWYWVKREDSPIERRYTVNSLADLIFDFPIIFSSNYLWFAKADTLLQTMERIMNAILPYQEGQDMFNETLSLLGQIINLMLICPLGILTGSQVMVYAYRVAKYSKRWYSWHRRQTTLIFVEPENKPE